MARVELRNYRRAQSPLHTLFRLFRYFRHCRVLLICAVASILAYVACTIGASYCMRPLTNLLKESGITPNETYAKYLSLLAGLGTLYFLSAVTNYLLNRLMLETSTVIMRELRAELFARMQKLPISYFDANTNGSLMSYYTNDIEATNELLQHSITQMLISVTSLRHHRHDAPKVHGCLPSWSFWAPSCCLSCASRQRSAATATAHSRRTPRLQTAYIEEMIAGQRDIKVFTHEKQVMADFEPINDALYSASTTATTATSVVGPILNNLSHMFYAITCAVGTLWLTGEGTGGILITFLQYIRTFADRVSQIADQFNSIMLALAGAERIFDVLDTPAEIDEGSVTLAREGRDFYWVKPDGTHVPLKGDVRFYNVDFSYDPDKPVLKNLSLYAKPGQKIAFVGSTGGAR